MLTRWNEWDHGLRALEVLRRRMDRVWSEVAEERGAAPGVWPRVRLYDTGETLLVQAEVPGLAEKDLRVTLDEESLTIAGERKEEAPAGWSVHRQERAPLRFTRTLALPCKVDRDKVTATTRAGVLTITLSKSRDAQPRSITVIAA